MRRAAYVEGLAINARAVRVDIEDLIGDFEYLDDWEDRYRYVIELGKQLDPLDDAERTKANKVEGCVSQVWLASHAHANDKGEPVLEFRGDSDAHIVRGLIAILFRLYSGETVERILAIDPKDIFHRIGLDEHLSPQRSNGLHAMVRRIRADAEAVLSHPPLPASG